MQTTEAPRQEKCWRILREGEISPFKIVTVIFIRESYIHIELRRGSPEERCATVRLINLLITSNEMTFAEFKAHLEDPKHSVRPEILKRFNKVLQNLEEVNASFLYELVHSVIDVEATQTNILRKRITKNSPFGKFLRIVLLNLRKMSYPQALYLYQQLCAYLHPLVEFKKPCWLPKGSSSTSSAAAAAAAAASNSEATKIKIESPVVVIKREIDDMQLQENIPIAQSIPSSPPSSSTAATAPSTPVSVERQHEFVLKPLTISQVPLTTPTSSSSSTAKSLKADRRRKKGLDIFLNMVQNRRKNNLMGLSMDVNLSYEYERKKAHGLLTPEEEESYCTKFKEKREKVERALESIKSLRLRWNPPQPNPTELQFPLHNANELNSFEVSPESSFQFQPKRQKQRTTPKKAGRPSSARKPKSSAGSLNEGIVSDADSDYFLSEDESPIEKSEKGGKKEKEKEVLATPTKRDTRSSSSSVSSPTTKFSRSTEKEQLKRKISSEILMQPENAEAEKQEGKVKNDKVPVSSSGFTLGSKRWSEVKFWSRKQIEQTIKLLAADFYHAGSKKYEPARISAFIEAIKHNPSAQVLLPQLHYLEYLNCLRLKDLTRCTESLRTSFDLRIKPNTSELNKGTPYAAYNFAVFYRLMGFKKDSMLYLEEAFQAGHSAADGTCLHYCHNLWSNFYSKPYTEAIVTTTKEIDRHMAYLHSLNVIANAYDHHYQGSSPEDIIYQTLWHYGACEIEEIESILLVSLGSFFSVFGWHDIIAFACQGILYSRLRWPSQAYCGALCLLAQTLLMEGDVELASEIMNYGQTLFGLDSSAAGELFGRQHSIFQALSAYLSNEPVDVQIISCIAAYDKTEALFWRAYNKLINNDWEESEKLLRRLSDTLLDNQSCDYCQKNELKLRCLLLQAELRCLCGKPTGGLQYLFEALNVARSIYSDHYIAFCLVHIASIQCELGLLKTAGRTLYEEMRSISRSSCPLLTAKLNIVSVKSSLRLCGTTGTVTLPPPTSSMSKASQKYYLLLLDEAEEIYGRWKNNYRLRDILYLKSKLTEISCQQDSNLGGGGSTMMEVDEDSVKSKIGKLPSKLIWTPGTCLM